MALGSSESKSFWGIAATGGLEVYLVGGAVRDLLLGRTPTEYDYVVVGATVDEMLARGFRLVGKGFPVFLHPETQEEYALARIERKIAPGYHGFAIQADPSVTLEEDLRRRDLTINALALAPDGRLIDPYGGQADLEARVLRHVSPAFAEDPVRILRVARFAARFAELGFELDPETLALMRGMAEAGEVDALVPERVWQELVRALAEPRPSRFFEVLRDCGALARLFPEIDRLWGIPQKAEWHPEIDCGVHVMLVIDMAARLSGAPEVVFAALCHDLGKGTTPVEILPSHHGHEERGLPLVADLCNRLRAPNRFRELGHLVTAEHGLIHRVAELRPATILDLLERADALRRPERFEHLLVACEADFRGRLGYAERSYPQAEHWRALCAAAAAVDAGAIVRTTERPELIPQRIRTARLAAIHALHPAPLDPV
ncbi:multifunctional CCA addition/repair protein [Caldichromatium japonicum]|uniref:Multifunctional CCA protein n=1 Tax=Caldichromatium japonicum TaxID=2699430 RepID=A0A6G7VD15_9GAMM|nr:multifunctional CCA addition/repair protein [Caldichromatium japonicum]QIK37911.1 multifunctional CCA addition/repair protein [Caldichromatium japonicum]